MTLTRRRLLSMVVACAWWRGERIRYRAGHWWHVIPDGRVAWWINLGPCRVSDLAASESIVRQMGDK